MSQKYLFHTAIILLSAGLSIATLEAYAFCKNNNTIKKDGDVIIIRTDEYPLPGTPRSVSLTRIDAYYDYDTSCVYVNLSEAGSSVDVSISNTTTGESYALVIPGSGASVLPISGTSGYWTITFTLENGSVYYGYFVL